MGSSAERDRFDGQPGRARILGGELSDGADEFGENLVIVEQFVVVHVRDTFHDSDETSPIDMASASIEFATRNYESVDETDALAREFAVPRWPR